MIKGIGIDLIETSRFSKASEDFLEQIFNIQEIKSVKNNSLLLSIKFALKESILKALGKGLYFGFFWHNIQLKNDKINISGPLRQNLPERRSIHTGTGNSKKYACAIAIIEHNIKQEVA